MQIDGYIRVSTDEQAKHGVSLKAQRSKIGGYHAVYGSREGLEFELGTVEVDDGVSGKSLDRPALRRALARLDSGASDGLIVAKMDRLTRDLGDWQTLIKRYFGEKGGRRLIAVDNEVNTMTSGGRLMLNMLVMVAQWERETIAERVKDSLKHKISNGERCGTLRYGHGLDSAGPTNKRGRPTRLTVDPREQEAIALMVGMRQAGASLRAIAAAVTAAGFPTRGGMERWEAKTVDRIIRRETA